MRRILVLCLLAAVLIPTSAMAASTTEILRDCQDDGQLEGHYTPQELRKAAKNIPTDVNEYSDCADVLARASTSGAAGAGGGGAGGGGGATGGGSAGGGGTAGGGASAPGAADVAPGSLPASGPVTSAGGTLTPATPQEQAAVDSARSKGGSSPVRVGQSDIVPNAAPLAAGAPHRTVPAALLIALILLAAAAVAAAAPSIRRVIGRRRG